MVQRQMGAVVADPAAAKRAFEAMMQMQKNRYRCYRGGTARLNDVALSPIKTGQPLSSNATSVGHKLNAIITVA